MDRAAVDACVAVQARQTLEETQWLLQLADAHPFVAGVIGWVDLQADDAAEQLERFVGHPKFLGVRHIVQGEPDDRFMLRPAFCRGISLLEDRDLTYDILIYPKHLAAAAELVSRFKRQRFVLDHLAKLVELIHDSTCLGSGQAPLQDLGVEEVPSLSRTDEGACLGPCVDEPLGGEHSQCFAKDSPADAEQLTAFCLTR